MKIKFTALLMLAISFAGLSVFTSCKDNDEDEYNELRTMIADQNTKLTDLVNAQVSTLKGEIETLKSQLAAIKSCACDPTEVDKKITDALNQYAAQHPELSKSDVTVLIQNYLKENNYITKPEVEALLNKALEAYCQKEGCLSQEQVIKLIDTYAKAGIDKATVEELIKKAVDQLATQAALEAAVAKLETAVADAEKKANNRIDGVVEDITKLDKAITEAKALAQKAYDLAVANGKEIDELKKSIKNLEGAILDANTEIGKVRDAAAAAAATAKSNTTRIEALESIIKTLSPEAPDMSGYYTKAEIDKILEDYVTKAELEAKAAEILKAANDYTDEHIKCFGKNVMEPRLAELETAFKLADAELQKQIDDIKIEITNIKIRLTNIEADIVTILGDITKIKASLKKLMTGIVLQGAENDVIGTFNTPVGINNNILVAYYGETENEVYFPAKWTGNYVFAGQVLTDKEWDMIKPAYETYPAGIIFNEKDGNAGTLYVTINPNSINFEGETLDLVNSQDAQSKVVLSPLAKSDKLLKFGFTRAANNGFYEAKATLAKADIDAVKMDIEPGLTESLKNIAKEKSMASVNDFANLVFEEMNGVLDANAVKATWTDDLGDTRSIYSQYGIAATAVKPLGFSFMKDVSMPGHDQLFSIIDKIAQKVKDGIKDAVSSVNFKFDLVEFDENKLVISLKLEAASSIVTDGDKSYIAVYDKSGNFQGRIECGKITDNGDGTYNVELLTTGSQLVKEISDSFDEVDKQFTALKDDLQDLLDMVNNAAGKIDSGVNTIKDYIDKVYGKANVFKLLNNVMQPVMIGSTSNGSKTLSQASNYPTVLGTSSIDLYLTSYNKELLAPCYKKHVACVNVINGSASAQGGDAACKAALDAFNAQSNVNKVLDGTEEKVSVSGLESGVVYEIAYSALDYSGKIVTRRFYVTL